MYKIKMKYWVIPLLLIVSIIIIVRSGVYAGNKHSAEPQNTSIAVNVIQVGYVDSTPRLSFNGSLEGKTTATLSSKIAGRIGEVLVQDGQAVKAGEPLVKLESVELTNSVRQAADAVKKAEINFDLAKNDYDRYKALYDKGAISAQQLEAAKAKYKIAEADLSSTRANHSNAKQQFGYSVITSPLDGVVANKAATIGQVVSPGAALMVVQDINQVYAVVNVEQKNLSMVKLGQTAEVKVDTYPEQTFSGIVEVINPEAGSANRMFRTKILIDNTSGKLKPGMFANIQLLTGKSVKILTVPQAAVVQKQGLYYVFTIKDGKALRKQIDIGEVTGSIIEVKSGLESNDQVITTSVNRIKDGTEVRVTP